MRDVVWNSKKYCQNNNNDCVTGKTIIMTIIIRMIMTIVIITMITLI